MLAALLALSATPYASYVPEPRGFLHEASAEAKQLWVIGALALMARSSTPGRAAVAAAIAAGTVAALPARLWRPQLARVGGLAALIFIMTAAGADGVAPLLCDRAPPAAAAATTAAAGLPSSAAHLAAAPYRYVLLNFGIFTVTKRGVGLAAALAGLTFASLQAASLALVTTPPERLAAAVGRGLAPARALGAPVRELVLTTLLALRFMATVLEEARNLALGVAARGLDWRALGWRGGAGVAAAAAARLLANLMARAEAVALAMAARGFAGAEAHALHAEAAGGARGGAAQWAADAALLAAFAALCAACWAL